MFAVDKKLSFITEEQEHGTQFATRKKAMQAERLETQRTGVKHTIHLTTTYRSLEPRLCWTIIPVLTAFKNLKAQPLWLDAA